MIRHFDGSVSSNVRYVTCSHGTDCHAESLAGGVHCFKMAKIDPVSPFYPTLWLKRSFAMGKPTRRRKNEPLGCKYLLLRVSKLEVFTQLPQSYHENSWTSMVSYLGGGYSIYPWVGRCGSAPHTLTLFNPLSPNSYQHQFSPNNIHRLSSATSMRINQMITKRKISDLLSISHN